MLCWKISPLPSSVENIIITSTSWHVICLIYYCLTLLNAYGAFLRYLKRVVVFLGNITHGGQGRENPESFWHKLSQILLNVKNATRAGFNRRSAAWERAPQAGLALGRPGLCCRCGVLGVPCFPLWVQTATICSRKTLPNSHISCERHSHPCQARLVWGKLPGGDGADPGENTV